jgi:hypothetical protein
LALRNPIADLNLDLGHRAARTGGDDARLAGDEAADHRRGLGQRLELDDVDADPHGPALGGSLRRRDSHGRRQKDAANYC